MSEHNVKILMEEAKNNERAMTGQVDTTSQEQRKNIASQARAGFQKIHPKKRGYVQDASPGKVSLFFSGQVIVQTEIMKNRRQKEARAAKTRARGSSSSSSSHIKS